MKELRIQQVACESPLYVALLDFRNRLLRAPLGLNLFEEDLSDDCEDIILVALRGDAIVGCVMLHPLDGKSIKLRQMAVDETLQGKGLGRQLVEDAEIKAKERGYDKIILHARINARAFYERLGYIPFGELFTEVSIPHIAMEKILS